MITISPGHWTVGTGASDIIDEVTEARKVASRVAAILRKSDIVVNYVVDNTSKNKSENLKYLLAQHNKTSRQLDVSVHFNASAGRQSKGIGTEVLYVSAKDVASKVSKAIASASGLIDRGAKYRDNLAFLNGTNKPAVLIEVCFVNSVKDVELYNDNFESICQAIAKELAVAVGKSVMPSTDRVVEDKKEVAKVEYNKDEKPSAWAEKAVAWAKENGISDGTYLKRPATREEVITMLYNIQTKLK